MTSDGDTDLLHRPPADVVDRHDLHRPPPPPPEASAAASLRRRHRATAAAAARRNEADELDDEHDHFPFMGTRRRRSNDTPGDLNLGRRTAANHHRHHRDRGRDRDRDVSPNDGAGAGMMIMTPSRLYCLLSFLVALLAIVTSSSPFGGSFHDDASSAAASVSVDSKVNGDNKGGRGVQGSSSEASEASARDVISLAIDAATGMSGGLGGGGTKEPKTDAAAQEKDRRGGGGTASTSDKTSDAGAKAKKRGGDDRDRLPHTLPTTRPRSLTGMMDSYYRWWDAMVNSYVDDAMVVADAVVRTVFWPWNVGLRDDDEDEGDFEERRNKASGDRNKKHGKKRKGGEGDGGDEDNNGRDDDHNFWLDLLSPRDGNGEGKQGSGGPDERKHKKHHRGGGGKTGKETVLAEEQQQSVADRVASFLANFIDPSLLPNSTSNNKNATEADKSNAPSDNESPSKQQRGRGGRSQQPSSERQQPPRQQQQQRPRSATDVIDKVLTSTPRLVAVANFLLAVTYLLHVATADWFLRSPSAPSSPRNRSGVGAGGTRRGHIPPPQTPGNGGAAVSAGASMGGFLLFKLLLVSSVLSPDTADVLILLSWYTSLSFLRSLAYLAHETVRHNASAGLPPHPGAAGLLRWVACLNVVSGLGCVALFHGAGMGMVVLLVTDCAVLTVDVAGYGMRHLSHVSEERHAERIAILEERQLGMLVGGGVPTAAVVDPATINDGDRDGDGEGGREGDATTTTQADDPFAEVDREMEMLESRHTRRLAMLDAAAFGCEVTSAALTAAHFGHIWYLHGLGFGLVDGVLALHLNSALTSVRRKIAERRNFRKIARDLDGLFEDATESEMRKAHSNGDMCSVCLRPMMSANVKKLLCGHLYHSHCLMEVVERARSIEAARCPLCRSSVVHVAHSTQQRTAAASEGEAGGGGDDPQAAAANATGTNDLDDAADRTGDAGGGVDADVATFAQEQQRRMGNQEDSLFRFSTEGILPSWLPIPAFSFEVVRRPPVPFDNGGGPAVAQQQGFVGEGDENVDNGDGTGQAGEGVDERRRDGDDGRNGDNGSFLLRLLHLAGAVPMTEDEEAAALIQLTDMFPQYDRSDLVRELRHRGSAELVAESILMGTFNGLPRAVEDGGDAQ